jgi:multidrug efflux pump subunit AcrA (membrane-fusion protein)
MKTFPCLFISVSLAIALTGCGRTSSRDQARDEHVEHEEHAHAENGVTFSAKRGVHVPAETAAFLGLKVADVEERPVRSEFRFSAQVHRATAKARLASVQPMATTTALASGDVSPEEAHLLQRGQSVAVQLDHGISLPGRVTEVHAHTDKAVEHFDVTVAIDDRDAQLATGTFVTVKAPVGSDKPVVSVPRSALLQTAEGKFVYTVSGEHFVRTAVKTGVVNDQFGEITDGLYGGDKVAVTPVMTLWMAELQSIRGGKACADGH